jgi:glutamate dehydrogenase
MTSPDSFLAKETEQFRSLYVWLSQAFSEAFLKELGDEAQLLISHSLVGFKLHSYYSTINFENSSIVLSRNDPDSDYIVYQNYESRTIASFKAVVSETPLLGESHHLRITLLTFGAPLSDMPEEAKRAQDTDLTQCELLRSPHQTLELKLSCREAPRKEFVGRIFRTLLDKKASLGGVFFAFYQPDVLYFEAELQNWVHLDVQELAKELVAVRDFVFDDQFSEVFEQQELVLFLRCANRYVQKLLVHVDAHMYDINNVRDAFCYWPELATSLYQLFCLKFDPYKKNLEMFVPLRHKLLELIEKQDTGKERNDLRRKTVLRYGVMFVDSILKTNFFVAKKGAISFRLDATCLKELSKTFPHEPFGIFYIYSRDFFGFHIRFQDLARGGMRTIAMRSMEKTLEEMPLLFLECYQLAWTQEKKNKDIPEGGSKAVCLLFPQGNLYRAQRLFIKSLLQLVTEKDGAIVDYYGMPEYLYFGPDENMHDAMIEWIANYSKEIGYFPGLAFITSKPKIGINHKRYGVTSFGVNVCMWEVLLYLGINPEKERFTVKMSGGPDGDVAGNQILNLAKYFPNTAKLITLIDVSGVIYDPQGLDLNKLCELFIESKPIRFYPADKLSEGGFLLDMHSEKTEGAHIVRHLRQKRVGSILQEEWLTGSEAQEIVRTFVHKTSADVFIPAGGRPATLNHSSVHDFLDQNQKPTAKAIIEGANLYLTTDARDFLEQKGTIIIKDSSANKGGVICSSYEVLSSLTLTPEEFLQHKEQIVKEILEKIEQFTRDEVRLILETHTKTKE